MFTTPKKPTSYIPRSSPSTVRLNGLFDEGIWKCNCEPRLPAAHFQSRKENPNKGKWFYTCQQPASSRCNFFLWDDKASSREKTALLNNRISETDALRTPADAARDKDNLLTMKGHENASNKFMERLGRKDSEDFGDWALSQEDEERLVEAVEQTDGETPRKAIKTSEFATPGSKRKRDEESLPTPVTGGLKKNGEAETQSTSTLRGDEGVFGTLSEEKRLKGGMWDGNERLGQQAIATPTPARFRDGTNLESPSKAASNYDITDEVLEILKDQNLDEAITDKLKAVLSKHAVKVSGIAKGREISRVAVQTRDAKIVELKEKISRLEAEREMDKTVMRHFKADMAHSVENRRRGGGRGRGKS